MHVPSFGASGRRSFAFAVATLQRLPIQAKSKLPPPRSTTNTTQNWHRPFCSRSHQARHAPVTNRHPATLLEAERAAQFAGNESPPARCATAARLGFGGRHGAAIVCGLPRLRTRGQSATIGGKCERLEECPPPHPASDRPNCCNAFVGERHCLALSTATAIPGPVGVERSRSTSRRRPGGGGGGHDSWGTAPPLEPEAPSFNSKLPSARSIASASPWLQSNGCNV